MGAAVHSVFARNNIFGLRFLDEILCGHRSNNKVLLCSLFHFWAYFYLGLLQGRHTIHSNDEMRKMAKL